MKILLGTTSEHEIAFDGQLVIKGVYQSGRELVQAVKDIMPDIVITDYILKDLDGIGRVSADRILAEANVDPNTRCRDLTDDEVKRISEVIDNTQTVEGDLRREIAMNIKRLQEIGCYRGIRHRKGLPVRGQKTKTNARTRKGPKRTVANKKK